MSNCQRSFQEAREALESSTKPQFYEQWADTYSTDTSVMEYSGPVATVKMLMEHLTLSPEQLRVLDVACGTGLVAQKLSAVGFSHFVGLDGSQAMLDKARVTGLYQELHRVQLGTQPLPVDLGQFDVVTMAGALRPEYVPVEVVRELCQATKPGGLVVMTQSTYPTDGPFTEELERELGRLEEQGQWKKLKKQKVEHYLLDPHQPGGWLCGCSYIYQKTGHQPCARGPPGALISYN